MAAVIRPVLTVVLAIGGALAPLSATRADDVPLSASARPNPFACPGEAESIARGLPTSDVRDEFEKRLAELAAPEGSRGTDQESLDAQAICVTAELMRRVGDRRAATQYERAIAQRPDEPGFEVWYADYLRNARGPRAPLTESAETHYTRALEKVRKVRERGVERDFDAITEERAQRGLIALYQQDGLPLSPWKAFPYRRPAANRPGVALLSMARISRDTNDFGAVDDARRFTSEAAFAASSQRLNRPLDMGELREIIRTPWRVGVWNGLRFRLGAVGAVDVSYSVLRLPRSQIVRFTEPNTFGDVRVSEAAVGFKRAIDLYPVADLLIDGGYRRVDRVGVVEWYPDLREIVNVYEFRPVASRFLGPDKVSLGANVIYMDIPIVPGGLVEDRLRARTIRGFYFDYAIYRPLLLPQLPTLQLRRTSTRGWHVFGGHVLDDEAFGVRVVHRRDTYVGTSIKGLGNFDFTLQGSMFSSETSTARRAPDGSIEGGVDAAQTSQQLRPTLLVLYRIVDEDVTPGLPSMPLVSLNLVVPVRHDFANLGANSFENTRVGAELWGKFISTTLRGTTFLLTAGYDVQRFHRLGRTVHMGHVDLRMGWNAL